MRIRKREETRQFSVYFPKTLVEEIDTIAAANFVTRNAWLIKAAKMLIEKEREEKARRIKEILESNE